MIPSKELMSEVLQKEVVKVKEIENTTLIYGCAVHDGWYDEINIYEFAHKCKEWATSKGYIMLSYMEDDKTGYVSLGDLFGQTKVKLPQPKDSFWLEAATELEAIFEACKWIMEQTKCGS